MADFAKSPSSTTACGTLTAGGTGACCVSFGAEPSEQLLQKAARQGDRAGNRAVSARVQPHFRAVLHVDVSDLC